LGTHTDRQTDVRRIEAQSWTVATQCQVPARDGLQVPPSCPLYTLNVHITHQLE